MAQHEPWLYILIMYSLYSGCRVDGDRIKVKQSNKAERHEKNIEPCYYGDYLQLKDFGGAGLTEEVR